MWQLDNLCCKYEEDKILIDLKKLLKQLILVENANVGICVDIFLESYFWQNTIWGAIVLFVVLLFFRVRTPFLFSELIIFPSEQWRFAFYFWIRNCALDSLHFMSLINHYVIVFKVLMLKKYLKSKKIKYITSLSFTQVIFLSNTKFCKINQLPILHWNYLFFFK